MNIILAASGVYVLIITLVVVAGALRFIFTGKEPDPLNMRGLPAWLFFAANVVCAITTIGAAV